jgi:hypothetical protein
MHITVEVMKEKYKSQIYLEIQNALASSYFRHTGTEALPADLKTLCMRIFTPRVNVVLEHVRQQQFLILPVCIFLFLTHFGH